MELDEDVNIAEGVEDNVSHLQIKFCTILTRFSVPDNVFSVEENTNSDQLASILRSLLQQEDGSLDTLPQFDFLISSFILRSSLGEHCELHEVSKESVIEVEFIIQELPPEYDTTLEHSDWVSALHAFDNYILTGSYDNSIQIWNISSGKQLVSTSVNPPYGAYHEGPIKAVRWIGKGGEGVNNSKTFRFLAGSHDQHISQWTFSPESTELVCDCICKGHSKSVDCLAVDSHSERFVSGSWDGTLKIWPVATDTQFLYESKSKRQKTTDSDSSSNAVTKSGDDDSLLGNKKSRANSTIATKTPILTLSGHKEAISSVHWMSTAGGEDSSSSQVCTTSWDHSIKIWNVQEGSCISTLTASKAFLSSSYSSLTQQLLTSSADPHIRLFDPRSNEGAVVKATYSKHSGWVSSVAWSPKVQYHFISGSYDSLMLFWDTRSLKTPMYEMEGHEDKILAVDWSVDSKMISGGADSIVRIFTYSASTTGPPTLTKQS